MIRFARPRPRSQYAPDLPELRRIGAEATQTGYVPIAPSQADALGPEHGAWVRLPGANFPPAGSIPFDQPGDANIAPGGVATLLTVGVPDTFRFRAAGIGFHCDDDVALGYLTWALLVGPDVFPGYGNEPAAVGSIRQLSEIFVIVGSSLTFTVRATIAATAPITYRYAARVRGWFYSEKEGR